MVSVIFGDSKVIRVVTRDYKPFMYTNQTTGQFENGIEFRLIQTIAARLKLDVEFEESPVEIDQLNLT